jgi:hypothetical protein
VLIRIILNNFTEGGLYDLMMRHFGFLL